ncbi:hypothetical protein [Bradyrhizobium arachidis]|uniref:hypothetical protein n=1 Tax=Bradyrhizobium arachidis TaxID=858423 RepID=UPI0008E69F1B|nr:hypothetical protein [Bradyrhizobium arachidis]SFV19807.1 hypothetical protein SAMN05192541_16412 [Bradyrhizobium arachidis]
MPIDFTVIQPVRQQFGDRNRVTAFETKVELEAPFVGIAKDFPFSCPNVDPSQMAVLQFESLGVTAGGRTNDRDRNILQINGVSIPGGITPGPAIASIQIGSVPAPITIPAWKSHSLVVDANVLRENNVLHIESVIIHLGNEESRDTFIIDNIVVFFKARVSGGVVSQPTATASRST